MRRDPRRRLIVAVVLAVAATLFVPAPRSAAVDCAPIELVFARGRLEAPGAGQIGNALAAALRAKTGRTVNLYAVRYPANTEVDIGANDMSRHIQRVAANCPNTKIVVGGYSLGAAVADVVLAVPISVFTFKNPLPTSAEHRIAAVALFGNGVQWVGPITTFNPLYRDRTIELCHGADPICNPTRPENWRERWPDHLAPAYIEAGLVDQAATFVAARV